MRRTLCAALILLLLPTAHSEDDGKPQSSIDQTAIALAEAARNLPAEARLQTTRAALSIVLLSRFNRLLPAGLDATSLDELASIFLFQKSDPGRQSAMANRLPPADSLVFDGTRLVGGNFRNIDSLIGKDGRPIALNRDLPAWIVPLTPAAAAALEAQREKFQSNPSTPATIDLTNRIYQAHVGENLAADGIFLRPYSGRIDDLYHHLAQQGNDATGLDFYALLDSLPPRQYSPISGTATRGSVPVSRFNLSDVLSGGSFFAIQKFRSENPKATVKNPFKGLAVRLLPFLGNSLRETDPGSPLRVSGETMRRAISDPRRFTPGKVPPLFNDPSRFLGQWADPRFPRVAKKKKKSAASELFEEIQKIDFETPLPEMNLDPAGNELLGAGQSEEFVEIPEEVAEENTADLMRDLGLPDEAPPPDPVSRTPAQPTPTPPIFTAEFKPAPPPLELETSPTTSQAPIEIAAATPAPTPEPTPSPTPATVVANAPSLTPSPTEIAQIPQEVATTTPAPVQQPPEVAITTPAPTPELTPTPTPAPVVLNLPSPAPSPTPREPSAVATVEAKDKKSTPQPTPEIAIATPTPTPDPTSTPTQEVQVLKAIPVEPTAPPTIPSTPSNPFQVAVLAPTATQAIEYLKTIAASDAALADNMAEFNRAECYIRWLAEAAKPFEAEIKKNPESEESKKIEELMQKALEEVVALKTRRDELKADRLKELESRQAARASLENEIQTTRRDELARLTGVGA